MSKNIVGLIAMTALAALSLTYAFVMRTAAIRSESLAREMEQRMEEQTLIAADQMKMAADCKTESELRILQLEYEIEKMKERGY